MKKYFFAGIFAIIFVFTGCKYEIVTEDNFNNNQPSPLSKFSSIQNNIFNTTCAVSGCHAGSNPTGNLNLSAGTAYTQLVNVNSINYPDQKRVVPGNKQASILYQVLSYNIDIKMPPSGKLDQKIIDSIGAWIDKGAPND